MLLDNGLLKCICGYPALLPYDSDASEMTKLKDEFIQFQLMRNNDVPEHVWGFAVVTNEASETKHYRADILWAYINTMKSRDGAFVFKRLAAVALLVY